MRASILNNFTGALGLAAVVASAPTLSSYEPSEECAVPSVATVFVTVPASTLEPSTVYVTVPASTIDISLSEAPTTTVTQWATLQSTTILSDPGTVTESINIASSSVAGQAHAGSPYGSTITEVATFTPLPSGGSHTYTETSASNVAFSYTVEDGTTYWLGGQTPASDASYVYSTSSVVVVPVYGAPSSEDVTSTLTLQSTQFITAQLTLTETLSTLLPSSASASAPSGTGLPYTKSSGGWNKTVTYSGVFSGATAISAGVYANVSPSPTLVLYSSFDIYETSHTTISLSTYAAAGGFNAFSTSTSSYANVSTTPSDPGASISSAGVQLTSAIINNQTVTWGGYSSIAQASAPTSSSAVAPYANLTSATSVSVTNGASDVLASLSSSAPAISYVSSVIPTNSTFATSAQATNTDSGAETSLSSSSSGFVYGSAPTATNYTTTASSMSSTPLPKSVFSLTSSANASITGTAWGALTSVSSSSNRSSTLSIGSYSFAPPVINSAATSTSLGALTSLVSSTSDNCTESASPTPSSALTSSTASSSALGGLTSLSFSNSATFSSSSMLPSYSFSSSVVNSTSASTYGPTAVPVYSSISTPSSTFSTKTTTNVSSIASATPTKCGEQGDFVLNFDDIPPLGVPANTTDVQPEPVFNPYHQFDFSDGFTVVPAPKVPYLPTSKPLFTEFIPNFNINGNNTQAGPNTAEEGYNGQISDGDLDQTGCFRFNLYGASMGCDSKGPACDFTFTGYNLDANRKEILVAAQLKAVPACPALNDCQLTLVDLDSSFNNLAFIRINVTVAGEPKIWWMDDLRLGWFDNSCAKGLCRQTTHVH